MISFQSNINKYNYMQVEKNLLICLKLNKNLFTAWNLEWHKVLQIKVNNLNNLFMNFNINQIFDILKGNHSKGPVSILM